MGTCISQTLMLCYIMYDFSEQRVDLNNSLYYILYLYNSCSVLILSYIRHKKSHKHNI